MKWNKMSTPVLSVCLITYNHVNYVRQALEGVLLQQVNFPWELIIADDFSTDGTRELLVEYKKKYPDFIKLLLQEKNVGAARNWLELIHTPRSKYIAYLEGDDYWTDPHKLQKQVDFLEGNEAYSMCFHEADVVNEAGFLWKFNGINEDRDFDLVDLTQSNFISTASTVFRKKNIEKLPVLFPQLLAGDWGLHFLNAQQGKIKYFKDCMSVYRQHEGGGWSSLSHKDMVLKGVELMRQLDKCFDYKYHVYFQEGIKKRLLQLKKAPENIIILEYLKLKNYIKSIIDNSRLKYDKFEKISFTIDDLDIYLLRTSVFNAIKEILPQLKGTLLDIGCGKMPYKKYILINSKVNNYIGLDIEDALEYDTKVVPDFTWNGQTMPFEANSFDCAFATEVLEHCPEPEIVLKEIFRVLKSGGIFFFTVPFLWNLHEVPHDEYRFTPFSMERHLKNSGFNETYIKALGGWHASLAQIMGLWVRRAPLQDRVRIIVSWLFKPIIKYLINKDKKSKRILKFDEGQMITGIYGIAKK
jgi:glycosyltransferase involved in cell wall biosynthesis